LESFERSEELHREEREDRERRVKAEVEELRRQRQPTGGMSRSELLLATRMTDLRVKMADALNKRDARHAVRYRRDRSRDTV
jgi:hypothetical protein